MAEETTVYPPKGLDSTVIDQSYWTRPNSKLWAFAPQWQLASQIFVVKMMRIVAERNLPQRTYQKPEVASSIVGGSKSFLKPMCDSH